MFIINLYVKIMIAIFKYTGIFLFKSRLIFPLIIQFIYEFKNIESLPTLSEPVYKILIVVSFIPMLLQIIKLIKGVFKNKDN